MALSYSTPAERRIVYLLMKNSFQLRDISVFMCRQLTYFTDCVVSDDRDMALHFPELFAQRPNPVFDRWEFNSDNTVWFPMADVESRIKCLEEAIKLCDNGATI